MYVQADRMQKASNPDGMLQKFVHLSAHTREIKKSALHETITPFEQGFSHGFSPPEMCTLPHAMLSVFLIRRAFFDEAYGIC